jgi:hypothetical protein
VPDLHVVGVVVTDGALIAALRDGREIKTPLTWFPRFASATAQQRCVWEICAAGHGIHWPLIDEDTGIAGLLRA